MRLLKEPLVHFLALGLALFVLYEWLGGGHDPSSRVIRVDRDALLTFMQYRYRAFEPRMAAERLDAMSEEELNQLVGEFVREEALYREALRLGLDQGDYIIKRRMIQSIEFVLQGAGRQVARPDAEALADYYAANREQYFEPTKATFTHVFVNAEPDDAQAERRARELLARLNEEQVSASAATAYGQRFPYLLNYVERDAEYVASHFGREFPGEVFAHEPSDIWFGPVKSAFGYHLVLMLDKQAERYPDVSEIADRLETEIVEQRRRGYRETEIRRIIEDYEVVREL